MTRRVAVTCLVALVFPVGALPADDRTSSTRMGPAIPTDKKILGFAPDLVDTAYLRTHIGELERIPIDGVFLAVHPDAKTVGTGDLYLGRINLASGERYKREDYRRAIADLTATGFTRFTDNFIDFSLCARNAYDWFDDKWSIYAENAAVLAHRRGREFMRAVADVYPDITIIMHPDTWGGERTRSPSSMEDTRTRMDGGL